MFHIFLLIMKLFLSEKSQTKLPLPSILWDVAWSLASVVFIDRFAVREDSQFDSDYFHLCSSACI